MSTSPAAWHPDPTGRHHLRYYDGAKWTDHVTTQTGEQTLDPVQAVANEPVVATSPSPPPLAPPVVAASQPVPTASVGATISSLNVTKPTIVAGIATIAALIGSLSMSWVTGTGDFDGSGVRTTISVDRGTLSSALDRSGLHGGELYRPFIQFGWVLAPSVCVLAALLSLGYVRRARVWTIVLAVVTTLWAIGTANSVSTTSNGETDHPAAGLYVVIAASVAAFIVAIVTRKSAASRPPA